MAQTKQYSYRVKQFYTRLVSVNGAPFSGSLTSFVRIATNEVTFEDRKAKYWTLIRNGQNATTSGSGQRSSFSFTPGNGYFRVTGKGALAGQSEVRVSEGCMFPISHPGVGTSLSATPAENLAIIRFVQRADSAVSALKGMVLAGELRETLRMIKSPAKALRKGLGDYLGKVNKHIPRVAKNRRKRFLSETWLESSFGWRPLINDIDSAMRALARDRSLEMNWQFVSASGENKRSTRESVSVSSNGSLTWRCVPVKDEKQHVRFYGTVHRYVDRPVYFHAANYGFRPEDFIPSLWELIPYSFLVDYFTNIGDVLQAWSFNRANLRWLSRTNRTEISRFTTEPSIGAPPADDATHSYITYGDPGSAKWTVVSFSRQASVSLGYPSIEFEIPGMSSLKWINIAALGRQHYATRKRIARL